MRLSTKALRPMCYASAPTLVIGQGRTLIAVLADGMGGHAGGAIASDIACRTFLSAFRAGEGDLSEQLLPALETANRAIATAVDELPNHAGMGCTLIGATFRPGGINWVSVGDSLLYLWRRGGLAILNDDHSLAPEIDRLAEAGVITWDDALADHRRHYLRSAVTGEEIELIDNPPGPIALGEGDVIVLASDGLDTLSDEQIAGLIEINAARSASEIAKALIEAVAAAAVPNQDNTTVVAVRVIKS